MAHQETNRADLVGDGWDDEPLMRADDVAEALAVSTQTVYRLPIPRLRITRGAVRWKPADVRAFLDRRVEA